MLKDCSLTYLEMSNTTFKEYKEEDGDLVRIFRYKPENSVFFRTARQEVAILNTDLFGRILFLDGILQSAEKDEELYHRYLVHSIFHPKEKPVNVLILGGGEGATLREVLKWNHVQSVRMIDWDEELIQYFKKNEFSWHKGSFHDPRVAVEFSDIFEVLEKEPENQFDKIIIDLIDPDPTEKRWLDLFERFVGWLAPGGSLILNAGGVFPWDEGAVPAIRESLSNGAKAFGGKVHIHQQKKYIPSFAREWAFVILKRLS